MRKTFLALSIMAVMTGCQPGANTSGTTNAEAVAAVEQPQVSQVETEKLNQWFEAKYEENLLTSPLGLTRLGRKERYHEIDDVSEAAQEKSLAWLGASVEELKKTFDYSKLDLEAQTSYDLWIYQYEQAKKAQEFTKNTYVFNQMQGVHAMFPQLLINFHKVDDISDMEAYNQRIEGVAKAIAVLQQRAATIAEAGVRPPRFAYEGVITQINNLLQGAPFVDSEKDAPLWADAKAKIEGLKKADKLDDKKAQELLAKTQTALTSHFQPAYQSLLAFVTSELDKTAINPTGVSSQPNGVAYYNHRLENSTTTSLTAEEIHSIGLSEVARITQEMNAIKQQVGFTGTLKEFFNFVKTDAQFFYPNTDEGRQGYISDSEKFLAGIESKLPEYFGILPKAPLVVKRVEAFREQPGAAQHYFPATPDGKRPGIYYAHLSDMKQMPKNEMEAVAYHEGSPGHHMQISIAQELKSVPTFRTQAFFTAFMEGWALYSEVLAKEMGGYQNPYSDFGRLVTEIWRAVRLVVDTGMHAKGWTEEEAVQYFIDHTPIAEGAIRSEVRRYLVWPGQATSYKIGMLKIQQLRASAEKTLGEKFDIRAFHDTVLGGGALPLDVLEKRVQNWVKTVQKA